MKKTVIQIIFCLLFIGIQLSIEFYPMTRSYSKKYICEMNVDSLLVSEKIKKYTTLLSDEEKKEFTKIKEFQLEFCEKK